MAKLYSLQDLETFMRVAELGNMSEVARQLNITNAAVSASIKRLEQGLNTSLLERTTRSLRLSTAGERFIPYVLQALGALDDAESELRNLKNLVAGDIHLGFSSDLGRNVLLPILDIFQQRYPRIRLTVHCSDFIQDLYREGLDVVIRYGQQNDSSLIAKKICDNDRLLVAAPAYIERHPPIICLEDLALHNCIYFYRNDRPFNQWDFIRNGESVTVAVTGDRSADDGDIVRRWAIAGHGIVYKSAVDVREDVNAGRLVKILEGQYQSPATPIYAVYKERKYQPYRLTALIQFLQETLAETITGHLHRPKL